MHLLCRHIEFRFRTYAEAQEAVEKLKEVREEIVAKQLSLDVSAGKLQFGIFSYGLIYAWSVKAYKTIWIRYVENAKRNLCQILFVEKVDKELIKKESGEKGKLALSRNVWERYNQFYTWQDSKFKFKRYLKVIMQN